MPQENERDYHPPAQPFNPLSPFLRDAQRINSALGEGFGLLQGVLGPQQLLDNIISILKSGVEVVADTEEHLLGLAESLIEEFGGEVLEQIPPRSPYQLLQRPRTDGGGKQR